MGKPYILNTTSRNQFGSIALEHPQPLRSTPYNYVLATLRSNNDFRLMARGFANSNALVDAFRCDDNQVATCLSKVKATMKTYGACARMARSIIALHAAAAILDYYITKYAAKPIGQSQNLRPQCAMGVRRLENKEGTVEPFKYKQSSTPCQQYRGHGNMKVASAGIFTKSKDPREAISFDCRRSVCPYGSAALDNSQRGAFICQSSYLNCSCVTT